MDQNDYLTTAEVAKILGLSTRRVREIADELEPVIRTPKLILFDPARVKEYAARPRPPRGPKPGSTWKQKRKKTWPAPAAQQNRIHGQNESRW